MNLFLVLPDDVASRAEAILHAIEADEPTVEDLLVRLLKTWVDTNKKYLPPIY